MLAPAAAAAALAPGVARLAVALVDGRSTVTGCLARSPARLLTPIHRGTAAWCYVTSFGGGLVAGDHLDLSVDVARDARLHLGTQASTKIFRAREGACTRQDLDASVASGGLLVNLPAHVTVFRDARFRGRNRYHLEAGANLLALDWFSAGRAAYGDGEHWVAAELANCSSLSVDGREILREAIELTPVPGLPSPAERMGPVRVLASVIVHGPLLEPLVAALARLQTGPLVRGAEIQHSLSPLPGGCLWRLAAHALEPLAAFLATQLHPIIDLIGDDPWRRVW